MDQSIDLRGFIRDGNVMKPAGFRLPDFTIDVINYHATCPAGQEAIRWSPVDPKVKNNVAFLVSFGKQCQNYPFFGPDLCTDKPAGRTISISRHYDLMTARRAEFQTTAFHHDMYHRVAIEGTVSELVRAHAACRSRYRGLPKNQLQVTFTAAATHLKRLAKVLANTFCRGSVPHLARSIYRYCFTTEFSTESGQITLIDLVS